MAQGYGAVIAAGCRKYELVESCMRCAYGTFLLEKQRLGECYGVIRTDLSTKATILHLSGNTPVKISIT